MSSGNNHLILRRVKTGSTDRYGDVIDARVGQVIDKLGSDGETPLARIKLVARADYIMADVLFGNINVQSRGRRHSVGSGEWIFLYNSDKIMLVDDGTYQVRPQKYITPLK